VGEVVKKGERVKGRKGEMGKGEGEKGERVKKIGKSEGEAYFSRRSDLWRDRVLRSWIVGRLPGSCAWRFMR